MRTLILGVVAAFSLLLVAGCGKGDVESSAKIIPAPAESIRLTEDLRFGAVDSPGSPFFKRIGHITVDDEGQIYVTDRGSIAVIVVAQDGKVIRNIGRQGQGPGEYRYVSSVDVDADSVLVWVPFGGVLVYDRETGAYRNQYALPILGGYSLAPITLKDGPILIANSSSGRPDGSPNHVLRFAIGDSVAHTILSLPSQQLLHGSNGSITFVSYLKGPRCAATNKLVYCGFNDDLRFTKLSTQGDSLGSIEVEFEPRSVSVSEKAAFEDKYAGTEFAPNLEVPAKWPAYDRVIGDDNGNLWITVDLGNDDITTLWVINTDGGVSKKAELDGIFRPHFVGSGKLYGIDTDTDGDETVVRYSIAM